LHPPHTQKTFTITLESCLRPHGILVHNAVEGANTMDRNNQYQSELPLGARAPPLQPNLL
jgi:hypothetical protein